MGRGLSDAQKGALRRGLAAGDGVVLVADVLADRYGWRPRPDAGGDGLRGRFSVRDIGENPYQRAVAHASRSLAGLVLRGLATPYRSAEGNGVILTASGLALARSLSPDLATVATFDDDDPDVPDDDPDDW